jgi:hypothetical protein
MEKPGDVAKMCHIRAASVAQLLYNQVFASEISGDTPVF